MSRSALLVGLLALGVVGLPTSIAAATPDQLTLVSRGYDGRPGTGPWWVSDSVGTSISADGRRVTFVSSATNLWQGAPNGEKEVYVRDFAGPGITPVSRADGADGAPADDGQLSWGGGITPDGRYVDFAANLPETGSPTGLFGYRRDLTENRTTIVAADDHNHPVDLWPPHGWPAPVGDRYVLFQTDQAVIDAVGAVPGGIYLRDLEVGRSVLVGRATGQDGAPVDVGLGGASPGGRYVTFTATSGILVAGPEASNPAGGGFLYLRDVRLGQTILVSRADGRTGRPIATRTIGGGQVRGDGCQVVFTATGTDIADGSPANGGLEVYLRDVCQGTTTLVSRAEGDGPAAATVAPTDFLPPYDMSALAMSADGRYVLFGTTARNLAAGMSGQGELYLRDMIGKRTILVSRADGPNGVPSGGADLATMTPDARYVVFTSAGTVLAPGIINNIRQVFRRELGSVPPAPTPVRTCGAIDDPGIGGTPAPPCPRSDDDDNGGDDPSGGGLPTTPKPVTVTVPGTAPTPSGGPPDSASTDTPGLATTPTLIRAPTLSAVTATATAVRAWVDLPATVQVIVTRQTGRRRQTLRTLKVTAAKAGRISVKLPHLARARYRLTIRALGPSGTKSPAIVRTIDLRIRRTKKP
ncbi:MAG TPA: hypothetical protein VFY45_08510 [Baekduia sp.]|nr:hypothetical protein [Baekduia sp.]